MNEMQELEEAVRDRALELDLESLAAVVTEQAPAATAPSPEVRSRASRSAVPLVAAALLLVAAIAWLERAFRSDEQSALGEEPEPPVVWTLAEVRALPESTRAVVVVDARPQMLEELARCRSLRRIVLERSPIPGARDPNVAAVSQVFSPVAGLAELVSLQEISLADGHRLDPQALAALERLPVLRRLEILPPQPFGLRAQSAWFAALGRLELTELVLGTRVGFEPGALEELASLRGLQRLVLPLPPTVTMDEVLALRRLKSLRALSFPGGAGLRLVEAGKVLDDRLADLVAGLPALEELQIGTAAKVSSEAWARIVRARPWKAFGVEIAPRLDDRSLGALPASVRHLALGDGVADSVLQGGLPHGGVHLASLALQWRDEVDVAWIRSLDVLPDLAELDLLTAAGFGTPALQELPRRVPALRILRLRMGPHLEAPALEAIARIRTLRELDLSGSATGFVRRRLDPTHEVAVGELRVVAERRLPGLEHLAELSDLRVLHLDHCAEIPATTLRALAVLPLRRLSLRGTAVAWDAETPDLGALRALWPAARIDT